MTKFPMLDRSVTQRGDDRSQRKSDQPKAVGIVRVEVSGRATERHAIQIKRHAEHLGYLYLYTVRPPEDRPDPIGYGLAIAVDVGAAAVVTYDLTTVDHSPARICDWCDLETVCPRETWARSAIDPDHARSTFQLTVPMAQRIMQQHRACSAHRCPRKSAALGHLVQAGKVVPPELSPRERAALRGLRFEPVPEETPMAVAADMRTVMNVLNGLMAGIRTDRRR